MSRFNFRLQKVLELKEWREREVSLRVALARREAEEAQRVRDSLAALRQTGAEQMAEAHGTSGPIGHLQNLAQILALIEEQMQQAETECEAADARVHDEVQELAAAVRARQALSQLKDKQRVAWNTGQADAERKLLDEIALSRHVRGGDAGAEGGDA